MRRWAAGFLGVLGALILTSCETPVAGTQLQGTPISRVTLAPGDVVKVTFSGVAELNQSQKIRADGRLNLPQVGEVVAAGKTLAQLQGELTALYRPLLQDSDVLITLESGMTRIFLSGAINKPGPMILDRPTTLLQAIMQAGGPNQFGNLGRVQIIRLVNGQERSMVVDLRPTMAGHATRPFYVRDGDIISIPQKAF